MSTKIMFNFFIFRIVFFLSNFCLVIFIVIIRMINCVKIVLPLIDVNENDVFRARVQFTIVPNNNINHALITFIVFFNS